MIDVNLILQFVGALAILIPFSLFQLGWLSQHGYPYLALNLVGAAILTAVAFLDGQWGFVILQVVWAFAAAWGIGRRMFLRRVPMN